MKKSIVFFDLETTGLDIVKDRIVQLGLYKVDIDEYEIQKTFFFNPEYPISEEAFKVHGISEERVKDVPTFKEKAQYLYDEYFKDSDLVGFNILRFDIPLLAEEFYRCGIEFPNDDVRIIDVQSIYHEMEKRTLVEGYKFYTGKVLENAHDAMADIVATKEVLESQVKKYGWEYDVDMLSKFGNRNTLDYAGKLKKNENGEVCFTFGKWKDKPVCQHLDYVHWMLNADFSRQTKSILKKITNII